MIVINDYNYITVFMALNQIAVYYVVCLQRFDSIKIS